MKIYNADKNNIVVVEVILQICHWICVSICIQLTRQNLSYNFGYFNSKFYGNLSTLARLD